MLVGPSMALALGGSYHCGCKIWEAADLERSIIHHSDCIVQNILLSITV